MSYGRDPQETANKYLVNRISESEFELNPIVEGFSKVTLELMSASLNFKATPQYVRRYVSADEQPYYIIECLVSNLNIGFGGPDGGESRLVDDCMFVIDDEVLKYATLMQISILSEEQYNIQEIRNLANMGKAPPENKQQLQSLAKLKLSYFEDGFTSEVPSELVGVMGLSKNYFDELLRGCLNEKVTNINFHGWSSSLSASPNYRPTRDLILFNEQPLYVRIDSFNFDYSCVRLNKENT